MPDNLSDIVSNIIPAIKVGTAGALILKGKQILELVNELRHNSIKDIQKQIAIKNLDTNTKEILEEWLNRLIFKKATGVNKPKEIRDWIISTNKSSNGSLTIRMFSQAQKYIKHDKTGIYIELNKYSRYYYYLAAFYGLFMLLGGATTGVIGAILFKSNLYTAIGVVSSSVIMIAFSITLLNDAASYNSAKQIHDYLDPDTKQA